MSTFREWLLAWAITSVLAVSGASACVIAWIMLAPPLKTRLEIGDRQMALWTVAALGTAAGVAAGMWLTGGRKAGSGTGEPQ